MEFPHLNDTQFPLLNNVNVYSYRNEFDYTRWTANTKVKLTNVLWNSDYKDVVKFDDNTARDEWFDSNEGDFEVVLTSNHSIPPEGGIKLPIPYDIAIRYNYMVVDIPVMTSESNPIEYENIEDGVRRWFFFVDEVSTRAPNTTMFIISLDVWMQFHNDIDINYLFLERGHAPVAATDVDEYLSNPITHNDYLLTPDVTPTNPTVCRKGYMIPFGNGRKFVCFASTLSAPLIDNLNSASESSDYTYGGNISYSNTSDRYGYQLEVNGYGVGNGYDFSNLSNPVQAVVTEASNARLAHNTTIWGVRSEDVYGEGTFFGDVIRLVPQFMNSILGCFVVDESMVNVRTTHTLAGHTIYELYGNEYSSAISISKSDFAYPERYQRFAKLYTYPYAEIELTDNEGETVSVRIENTGPMEVNFITSVAFPYVNMRMFFTGIGGSGSTRYAWVNLWNNTETVEIADSDWFDYCFDHEIPCYALYMDNALAWYLDNFNRSIRGGRKNALVNYHNSVRVANTTKENVEDANATAYTNTGADATTMNTNANNSADTNRDNMDATIATNAAKVARANSVSTQITLLGNSKNTVLMERANFASVTTEVAENQTTAAVARTNANAMQNAAAVGGVAGAALWSGATLAMAGAGAGAAAGTAVAPGVGTLAGAGVGLAAGGVAGLAQAMVNAGAAVDNSASVIQANEVAVTANNSANRSSTAETNSYNSSVTYDLNDQRTQDITADNNLLDANTDRSNDNLLTNTANTAATMLANMGRTCATGNANAGYTRGALVDNAKETLENSRRNMQYYLADAGMGAARAIGNYAGDPTADYMRTRGVQMKIRTMSDSEIRQVGDWFARYGYALDQNWDVSESGLCPMEHFCYWKCRDIWIDDRKSSNNAAVTLMATMFERGVTVWKNPDEVGKVSIYDN